jgi:hypothetical protein
MESTTGIPVVTPHHRRSGRRPLPNYSNCRHLPERDRWTVYETAKAGRLALQDRGIIMDEAYEDFVWRVTGELDL